LAQILAYRPSRDLATLDLTNYHRPKTPTSTIGWGYATPVNDTASIEVIEGVARRLGGGARREAARTEMPAKGKEVITPTGPHAHGHRPI